MHPFRFFDKPVICTECCQSCKMGECNRIFTDCGDLEIFSVVTGCLSLLMVLFLIVIVARLSISLHKLKNQKAQKSPLDLHSYNSPAIQPNEELAVRGFSMFSAQEDSRAPIVPQEDDYPRKINPHFQPPADRAPYVQEKDQYFGNFDPQPRHGRYAY